MYVCMCAQTIETHIKENNYCEVEKHSSWDIKQLKRKKKTEKANKKDSLHKWPTIYMYNTALIVFLSFTSQI